MKKIEEQLASIMSCLIIAWGQDPFTGAWYAYEPAVPDQGDLDAYRYGWFAWIEVSAACTLNYQGFVVSLSEGWNEFVWLGVEETDYDFIVGQPAVYAV